MWLVGSPNPLVIQGSTVFVDERTFKPIKKFYTTLSQIFEDVPGSSFAICLMHLESKEKRKVT